MTQDNQSTPGKNKFVPRWVKSTPLWKSMSRLKLALKRMSATSSYWDHNRIFQTFRYFMTVEGADARYDFLNSFHFKGLKFDLRPMEWHLMQAILLEEEYGGKVTRLFEKCAPSVIIDAGANVGMFSAYVLSKWPGVKVLAVEPAPDTFHLLEQNQKQNPGLDWHVLQYAFWESDGTVSFENEGMSMASHISAESNSVQVPAIRLDHFIENFLQKDDRVSLLKMDIEGAEETVLKASLSVLGRIDVLVIEIHSSMCDESAIRDILTREFTFVVDLSASSTQCPVILAYREERKT